MSKQQRRSLSDLVRQVEPEPAGAHTEAPDERLSKPDQNPLRAAIARHTTPQVPPRPPKPKRLNVDLDPDFYDAVADKSRRDGHRSLSELVRQLLETYLSV